MRRKGALQVAGHPHSFAAVAIEIGIGSGLGRLAVLRGVSNAVVGRGDLLFVPGEGGPSPAPGEQMWSIKEDVDVLAAAGGEEGRRLNGVAIRRLAVGAIVVSL